MNPERWKQIERLYSEVSTLPSTEREAYLEQACGPDDDLRTELQQLLEHGERTGNVLDSPAWQVPAAVSIKTAGIRPGLRLGYYEIDAALGAGGMGDVWRARDTRLNRFVALKTLKAQFSDRFEREARAVAALNHPNIAALYDVGTAPSGFGYLVLEYVDGPTLADRIRKGPTPQAEAIPIARQLAEGIEAAHERGIIHRDLKPANIKLKADGTVKILDFGLAKALDRDDEAQSELGASSAGLVMGTLSYMSPEQALGKKVDRRTDIWSFGIVLYEMLTGKPAFKGETGGAIVEAVIKDQPDLAALPGGWRPLIERCLTKDVRHRLQAIGEARIALQNGSVPVATAAAVNPGSTLVARRHFVLGLLVAGLVAGGGFVYWRTPPAASDVPETRLEINTPSTNDPRSFAFSPDGKWLAYVAPGNGGSHLWIRSLDSTTAKPLTTIEGGAAYPFWSPDGRSIGFFSNGKLKTLDVAGLSVQTVTDAPSARGGTWGANGVIVFAPGAANPLLRVPAAGGQAVPATKLGASGSHRFPQFLPDGKHFIFYAEASPTTTSLSANATNVFNSIYIGTIDSIETKRLTPADTAALVMPPDWLVWVRNGTLVGARINISRQELVGDPVSIADSVYSDTSHARYFSVSGTGLIGYRTGSAVPQLMWYGRSGKALGALNLPGGNDAYDQAHSAPRISPNGQRVAVNRTVQGNPDVWILDPSRSNRLTFSGGAWPVWSPDGNEIVFCTRREGSVMLYRKSADGTGTEKPILEIPRWGYVDDWSPDGRLLLFQSQEVSTNGYDLWVMPLDGSRKPSVFLQTGFDEKYARFSPDGRWVAYSSNESGRSEVYIRAFTVTSVPFPKDNGIGQWQVSLTGGLFPSWSHDGKELYWIAPDSRMMMSAISSTEKTLQPGPPIPLFQTRINGGGLDVNTGGRQFDVAPDGRFLINALQDNAVSSITIVQNWNPRKTTRQ